MLVLGMQFDFLTLSALACIALENAKKKSPTRVSFIF